MDNLKIVLQFMDPWAVANKSFVLEWRYHQLLFIVNVHLPRVSSQSRDKTDKDIKPGIVHRSRIYVMAEEIPGKPQLGGCLMKSEIPVVHGVMGCRQKSFKIE